jgi:ribonuclease HII
MPQLVSEAYRLRLLRGVEERLAMAGFCRVAGVDEAGRGCLAGPVVAAAVLLQPQHTLPGVDDSKRLAVGDREKLAERICGSALSWSVQAVPPATIDRSNILAATRQAMNQALLELKPSPDCAVVDAVKLTQLPFPCLGLVRGDSLSYSVACASIVAKVERDRYMQQLDRQYPQYGFARHKGYAAAEHRRALRQYGPSPEHRLTFHSVLPTVEEIEH